MGTMLAFVSDIFSPVNLACVKNFKNICFPSPKLNIKAMPNFECQKLLWTFKYGLLIQDEYVTHHALLCCHQLPQGQGHMAAGGDVI